MYALSRFLHVLVFVYWLGGDLGAFVASYFVTDPKRPLGERGVALKILSLVDAAPTATLLLTLPTGVLLAQNAGWWHPPDMLVPVLILMSVVWVPMALVLHFDGAQRRHLGAIDRALRVVLMSALVATAGGTLLGVWPRLALPHFIAAKCLLLAAATACGLALRIPLARFVAEMGRGAEARHAELRHQMAVCRAWVLGIWCCLLIAAGLGIVRPTL